MSVDITWRKLYAYKRLKKQRAIELRKSRGSSLDTYHFKTCSELQTTFIRKHSFGLNGAKTLVELSANIVNTFPLPLPLKWTRMDVSKWLTSIQLPQYRHTFHENFIYGNKLLLLNVKALVKMNIHQKEHIDIILKSIRELFHIEMFEYFRDLTLPQFQPFTHYKLYHCLTGNKYNQMDCIQLFKNMNIITSPSQSKYMSHWDRLEQWLLLLNRFKEEFRYGAIESVKKAQIENHKRILIQNKAKEIEANAIKIRCTVCETSFCICREEKYPQRERNDQILRILKRQPELSCNHRQPDKNRNDLDLFVMSEEYQADLHNKTEKCDCVLMCTCEELNESEPRRLSVYRDYRKSKNAEKIYF